MDSHLPGVNFFDSTEDAIYNHSSLVELRRGLTGSYENIPSLCEHCSFLKDTGW
jgi:hypothetical protein